MRTKHIGGIATQYHPTPNPSRRDTDAKSRARISVAPTRCMDDLRAHLMIQSTVAGIVIYHYWGYELPDTEEEKGVGSLESAHSGLQCVGRSSLWSILGKVYWGVLHQSGEP